MSGLIVDLFAGGGGASVGIEAALQRYVDLAINHDPVAIAVHRANHPHTRHLEADVWEVQPHEAVQGRPVDLLWASPDCTHFSRAKGGKPRDHGNRSLAWVVVNWARETRPRIILLENVREFATWGPLTPDGQPDAARSGQHYDEWTEALRRLGYAVESRVLDASQYGAPTKRLRLFVVARCDGQPIRWPAPTHGDPPTGLLPVRTAAECIDWSLPCPSIFDRKRPLAPATLRRVAEGVRRFVLESADPFVVLCNHSGGFRGQDIHDPLGTITAAHDARGIVVPSLIHTGNGERAGQAPRTRDLRQPFGTVTATGSQGALVAPVLAKHYGGVTGTRVDVPAGTITARDHHGLIAPFLTRYHGERRTGERARVEHMEEPLPVQTTENRFGLVSAFLSKFYGTCRTGQTLFSPAPTLTAGASGGHSGLVSASIQKYYGSAIGHDAGDPLHTVTTKARFALVAAFLQNHGLNVPDPVIVHVHGVPYAIADIGLRMLEPHELLRAQFGEHADGYDLSPASSKAAKIRLIGNSVCPTVSRALVAANVCAPDPVREVCG